MALLLPAAGLDAPWSLAAPASPTPTPSPTSAVSDVVSKVAENVLTNLLTVVVLPLALPVACLVLGAAYHLVRRDLRSWWQSVQDFRRLGLGGGARGNLGGAVRYWLALLGVLLTGRLSDPTALDPGRQGEGT